MARPRPSPPTDRAAHGADRRHVERIIGAVSADHGGSDGHSQGIESGQRDLHLGEIVAVIFALAQLEQALLGDRSIALGGGAIDPGTIGRQLVDAQQTRRECRLARFPVVVICQVAQHHRQVIVGEIKPVHVPAGALAERFLEAHRPGLDMVEAMIAFGENVGEPNRNDPTQREPDPVAVGGEVEIEQFPQAHPIHLGEQERHIVDAFDRQRRGEVHTPSLSHASADSIPYFFNSIPSPRTVGAKTRRGEDAKGQQGYYKEAKKASLLLRVFAPSRLRVLSGSVR